jgi:hypothetical protein
MTLAEHATSCVERKERRDNHEGVLLLSNELTVM